MIQTDKEALHAEVIADMAHMIMVVAQELSSLYKDSFINNERIELRQKHLAKYVDKLNQLTKRFDSETFNKVDKNKAREADYKIYEDSYVQ